MKLLRVFFLIASLFAGTAYAQKPGTDSTILSIRQIKADSTRLSSYYNHAFDIIDADTKGAVATANEMLGDAQKHNNKYYEAQAYYLLGIINTNIQDYPSSVKYFLEALRIQQAIKDYRGQVTTATTASDVYLRMEDTRTSKKYVTDALAIVEQHNLADMKADVLSLLANLINTEGNHEEALKMQAEALRLSQQMRNKRLELNIISNYALLLLNNKRQEEALHMYQQAIVLADSLGNKYAAAIAYDNMANIYLEMGKYEDCERAALKALELETETPDIGIRINMYEVLKDVYTHQQKYPLALAYVTRWTDAKDSVLNEQKVRQIQELETKYQTEKKDQQIALQNSQISYNRKINFFLALSSFLLLVIGVVIYLTQRKIAKQKKELELVNAVKDKMFSVIGHDMRSPINSLVSFTQLLENGNMPQEKLSMYAAELRSTLGYTTSLMENLLNWAHTQMQGFKPAPEQVDVSVIVNQAVGLFEKEAAKKQVIIRHVVPVNTHVNADPNMMSLVIRNLVSNAIKFTAAGGSVALSAHKMPGIIRISVADTGAGIAAEFVRQFNTNGLSNNLQVLRGTAQEKGTGLGLMLCKNFAHIMKGKIVLESVPGKGSTFMLEIPG